MPGIQAIISVADQIDASWDVLFLSEADFLATRNFELDVSPHWSRRFWPGEGSRALRLVVHQRLSGFRRHVSWKGRAGMLEVLAGSDHCRRKSALSILGVHGPHEDEQLPEFFNDLSWLLASRSKSTPVLAVGDWNIDELPRLRQDPFHLDPGRSDHHSFRRAVRDS